MGKLWKVTELTRSKDAFYRWHVRGHNLETGEPFAWSVPDVDDDRYDLSDITTPEPR